MLTDPATPLGEVVRCRQALRDAGFAPEDTVVETTRFSLADLDESWEARVRGSHHDAINSLAPDQLQGFRDAYTSDLTKLLKKDELSVRDAEVIYAFGRKE